MRRLGWSSVLLLVAMLVACAETTAPPTPAPDGVRVFRADLRSVDGAAQPRGVSAAALFDEHLVVIGTFSDLGSVATRAAILDGTSEVFSLPVDRDRSGRFDASFDVTRQQRRDLRDDRYHIRIYSDQRPEGELQGQFALSSIQRSDEDASWLWELLQE